MPVKTPAGESGLLGAHKSSAPGNNRGAASLRRAFAMVAPTQLVARLTLIALVGGSCSSCTVVKPVVGLVTGPVLALSGQRGPIAAPQLLSCDETQPDGGAGAMIVVGYTFFGAVGGLVTGAISDWAALTASANDPTANWWDPWATNTGGRLR